MLYRYEYPLKSDEKLSYQMASLFHGALMELLPGDYAAYLHRSQLHPYAQHLERRDASWYWILNALDDTAAVQLGNALAHRKEIALRHNELKIGLGEPAQFSLTDDELRNIFYGGDARGYFNIRFLTPASFKRKGEYLIYPDLFCIFQSLMNKQDAIYNSGFMDPEALEELVGSSKIIRYKLSSTSFSLEGTRIPSFIGSITVVQYERSY